MAASAPRYDPCVVIAVMAFDDRREPLAEVWRRVNNLLESLGVTRVSYEHLRRLILEHRRQQDEARARRRALLRAAAALYGPWFIG